MSKENEKKTFMIKKSTKELLLTLVVGLVLTVVAFQVFGEKGDRVSNITEQTEKERKVSLLLLEI